MNKHNQELYDFVKQSYEKIKKQKKSPKNFTICRGIEEYSCIATNQLQGDEIQLGNLFDLYIDIVSEKQESKVEKKYIFTTDDFVKLYTGDYYWSVWKDKRNGLIAKYEAEKYDLTNSDSARFSTKEAAKQYLYNSIQTKIKDPYAGFDIKWIPIFKELWKDIVIYNYNELDEKEKGIMSEEIFNNITNWIKL